MLSDIACCTNQALPQCSALFICFVGMITVGGIALTEAGEAVKLQHIMVFFSGGEKESPLGFSEKPTLCFIEGNLAIASTCFLKMQLPFCHTNYKSFSMFMTLSLMGHDGFGLV